MANSGKIPDNRALDQFYKNTEMDGFICGLDHQYARDPNLGTLDIGKIDRDAANGNCGLKELPIRIAHGEHRGPTNGYGIRHILIGHGQELADDDWYSVQDFVQCVIEGFDAIYQDPDRPKRWQLVERASISISKHRIIVIEASGCGNFYKVITGWLKDGERRLTKTPVWERRDRSPKSG